MIDIPVTILNIVLLIIGIYAMFFVSVRKKKIANTEEYVGIITIIYLGILGLLQYFFPHSKISTYYSISYFLSTGLVIIVVFKTMDYFHKDKKEYDKMIYNDNYKKYYTLVDSKDIELITHEDIMWMSKLSKEDIQKIYEEDDAVRIGRFITLRKTGMDMDSAVISILHEFPLFYFSKEKRNELPGNENIWVNLNSNDMRLPFCIKNRFNNYICRLFEDGKGDIFKSYIDTSSTANAAIRRMINDGLF